MLIAFSRISTFIFPPSRRILLQLEWQLLQLKKIIIEIHAIEAGILNFLSMSYRIYFKIIDFLIFYLIKGLFFGVWIK